MKHWVECECPYCGNVFDVIKGEDLNYDDHNLHHADVNAIGTVIVDMDDVIDYIFSSLLKQGVTARSKDIFEVIMLYDEFLSKEIDKHVADMTNGDDLYD